jgi:transcriptional regulator with XRE-family HTH domain
MGKLTAKEEAKRRKLYDAGLSDKEIAERVGLTVSTIICWRHDRNLKVNKVETKRTAHETLCWTCQNTNMYKCPWFNPTNPQPVKGWKAIPKERQVDVNGRTYKTQGYRVIECPNYLEEK